jgi:5-formyltetrahydrofolate cyclo-ligase
MEEIKEKKSEIRDGVLTTLKTFSENTFKEKINQIENRLFDFANFLESKIVLLYVNGGFEVSTRKIIKKCLADNKIVVLPAFDRETHTMKLMKVDDPDTDLSPGSRGIPEPIEDRCKTVPIECIDIAIIPGVAFDEKGGRIGSGEGYYDKTIPQLAITTRKVALAFEGQIVPHVPAESNDRYIDIIITEERIIYKI